MLEVKPCVYSCVGKNPRLPNVPTEFDVLDMTNIDDRRRVHHRQGQIKRENLSIVIKTNFDDEQKLFFEKLRLF